MLLLLVSWRENDAGDDDFLQLRAPNKLGTLKILYDTCAFPNITSVGMETHEQDRAIGITLKARYLIYNKKVIYLNNSVSYRLSISSKKKT